MRENAVREWVQEPHAKGTCNPSDLFTKEMKDGVHFRKLRDSFMSRSSSFYKSPSSDPSLDSPGSSSNLVHLARAAKSITTSSSSGLLELVLSNDLFRTHSSVSHLSSAGRSILSKALSHQWFGWLIDYWSVCKLQCNLILCLWDIHMLMNLFLLLFALSVL